MKPFGDLSLKSVSKPPCKQAVLKAGAEWLEAVRVPTF